MPFLLLLFCILGEIFSSENKTYYNEYLPEEPTGKKFSELYGINKREREEITEIIYQMNHPEKYPRQPIGFLLKGKPGNGKSFLAEAIAKEIKGRDSRSARIIKASASSFINVYVGVGKENIKRLFGAAKKNENDINSNQQYDFNWKNIFNLQNPWTSHINSAISSPRRTIIIIDEISAIVKRTACKTKDSEDYKVITELLYQFDELNRTQNQNIKIIATTNDADLDEALIRSGRLETEIEIDDPNEESIAEIITHHHFIKKIKKNDYLNMKIKGEYELIPKEYTEKLINSSNQKELTENLTNIFFTNKEVSFRTVDIYSILDRAFTKINDETNSFYPIEVLLKLIYEKLYKNKNQGKNYLKNETKEKKTENNKEFYEFKGLVTESIDKLFTKCKELEDDHCKTTEALFAMQGAMFEKTNEQMMSNTKELIKIFTTEIKEIKKSQEHSQQAIECKEESFMKELTNE